MSSGRWLAVLSAVLILSLVSATNGQPEEQTRPDRAGPPRGGPPAPEEVYQQMDADGDGSVTLEEFKQHHQQRVGNRPAGPPPDDRGFGRRRGGGQQGDAQRGQRRRGFGRGGPNQGQGFQGPPRQGPPPRDGEGFGPPPPPNGQPGFGPPPAGEQGRFGPPPRRGFARDRQGPPCPHCQGTGVAPGGPQDRERPRRGRPQAAEESDQDL